MNKKRITLIVVLTILLVITGLYATYAINVFEEETTPTEYDMAFNFDLSGSITRQMTIPAGKTKVFDIDITNPYTDIVQYGVAYSLVSPTTLPNGVTIAESSLSKNSAVGQINASETISTSIIVVNGSTSSLTISFSVINGYKNGGSLVVPTGKVLVEGTYEVGPVEATKKIVNLSSTDNCAANTSGVCPTNEYTKEDGTKAYHEYRYRGAEVNNYVSFNNDLYRIIGVFDDYTHGVEGQYLIKLISANLLTANSWGNYTTVANQNNGTYAGYYNDWIGNRGTEATTDDASPANVNLLLNQYFYNKTNGLSTDTYGICQNWTFYSSNTKYRTNDCSDIVGYGISADVRDYIENVTWHLKGKTANGFSKQDFYTCERSGDTTVTDCNSGNSGAYAKSTTGKIGLMYVSDYMYASGYYASSSTQSGSGYRGNQNWLYKGYEWTITPDGASANRAFGVSNYGYLSSSVACSGYGVRPSLYLKSNVLIDGGEGTIDRPFTLIM